MPNILVVGAASGIGEEFVRAFIKKPGYHIIAVDKNFPQSSISPHAMVETYLEAIDSKVEGVLYLHAIDITNEIDIVTLSNLCSEPLDVIIHSAGVRGLEPNFHITQSSDVAKAETKNVTTAQTMRSTFEVNTVGSFLLLQATVPKLRLGGPAKVIIMGSRMGSIGHNTTGGGYAYRASKAALNAIVKSFAIDVPEAIFTIVHPGRVESGLVSVKEDGAISAGESVSDMMKFIDGMGKEHSGRFFDRFGVVVPW
ncbi:hypothetical protein JMJ35_003974 [Cladonia borealis]|uniref:NAD(P)-binding protein n=1 Tax=Cladonia borealis TaxID=184061 RepID=A0AA39R2G7_9LECA|nr:hypothetical protein JMJ35_003974 [Cladonia borealis]